MPELFEEQKPSWRERISRNLGGLDNRVLIGISVLLVLGAVFVAKNILTYGQLGMAFVLIIFLVLLKGMSSSERNPLPIDVLIDRGLLQIKKVLSQHSMDGTLFLHDPPRCYMSFDEVRPVFVMYYRFFNRDTHVRMDCFSHIDPFTGQVHSIWELMTGFPNRPVYNTVYKYVPVPNDDFMKRVGGL